MSSRPAHESSLAIPLQAILVAIGIHTLWGANPVAVKFGLLAFPPMWSAFLRFSLAVVCIAAWAWMNRIQFLPTREEWRPLFVLSLLFTFQIGTMYVAIDLSAATMSAVLIATNPLFAALFAHVFIAGDRLTPARSIGLIVAFSGTAVALLQSADAQTIEIEKFGNWLMLFSAAVLGGRLVLTAKMLQQIHQVRVVCWQMLLSLPLYAAGGFLWETIRWENVGWQPLAGIAYQGIVIAGLGFMLNAYLMQRYRPSIITSFNFISPIAGVLLAAWLLGEPVTAMLLAGMSLVGLGLYLIARK